MPTDRKDESQDPKSFILAVPSKGRREEKSAEIFSKAGLPFTRRRCGYQGEMAGNGSVKVEYVSVETRRTACRRVSAYGHNGRRFTREEIADFNSAIIHRPLGFGQADVVVAIPDGWAMSQP